MLTCDVVLDSAIGREPAGMCNYGVHARVEKHVRVELDRVDVAAARRQNVTRKRRRVCAVQTVEVQKGGSIGAYPELELCIPAWALESATHGRSILYEQLMLSDRGCLLTPAKGCSR